MKDTIKNYIERYVLVKIGSDEWKEGCIIPSETALSKQFVCSRITVRNALKTFVSIGILLPIKGIGYQVLNIKDKLFNSIHEKYGTNKNTTQLKDPSEIGVILDSVKDNMGGGWGASSAKDSFKLFEKLFYKDDELVVAQISIVNINILWGVKTEDILHSLTEAIYKNGIIPNRINQKVFFSNVPLLSKYFEELGYDKNEALISISEISNDDSWIEFSIRVVKKSMVNLTKSSSLVASEK